jgi:fluoroacetyl-CoA thioesterase
MALRGKSTRLRARAIIRGFGGLTERSDRPPIGRDVAMELQPGLRGEARLVVTSDETAIALGSGDVPVLGTPAVLALVENAACSAIAGTLDDGDTSVGVWIELEHLAASKPGAEVTAEAELVAVDGRTIEFRCEAREGTKVVARARHRRAVVDRERFLARA